MEKKVAKNASTFCKLFLKTFGKQISTYTIHGFENMVETGLITSFKGIDHYLQGRGVYKIGKSQVWNFLPPPPPPR